MHIMRRGQWSKSDTVRAQLHKLIIQTNRQAEIHTSLHLNLCGRLALGSIIIEVVNAVSI